jgi:integrase
MGHAAHVVPADGAGLAHVQPSPLEQDLADALQTWLYALRPHTRRSYETGLRQFAQYLHKHRVIDEATPEAAGVAFLGDGSPKAHGRANALAQAWLESLAKIDQRTKKPRYTSNTISARVTALRWAVREARRNGRISWTLDIQVPKPKKDPKTGRILKKKGRDMKGPSIEKIRELYQLARDFEDCGVAETILSLAFCETLRLHEILQLNIEDIHRRRNTLTVVRKMREEAEELPISDPTLEAMERIFRSSKRMSGPLVRRAVIRSGRRYLTQHRLSPSGLNYKISTLANGAGIHTSAHRIRHSGITVGNMVREELGISKQDAMHRAGHESEQAHQTYLDVDLTRVRQLTEGVGALVR